MIVTDHFVYVHVSRTGGTFFNKLMFDYVPGARMIQYHGHLRDLPAEFSHLPVIGFVRNPWDWYVSMFFDYRRKQQYVYQVLSNRNSLGFQATVSRFLRLGDRSEESNHLLEVLARTAPRRIIRDRPPRNHLPGLRADHFAGYPEDTGYYSWLCRLMFESDSDAPVHIGRFENIREEALRLLEETGTPITDAARAYLQQSKPLNKSPRPPSYAGGYNRELAELVAAKDRYIVDRFGYEF